MSWLDTAAGNRLWVEVHGNGPAIVLLHGWSMSSAVWRPLRERLGRKFRLVALDFPGHGSSPPALHGKGLDVWCDAVLALYEQLELDGSVLLGWSMGGQAALALAERLKPRLSGLVLACSTPCFRACHDFPYGVPEEDIRGMRARLTKNSRRALLDFRRLMLPEGEGKGSRAEIEQSRFLADIPVTDTATSLDGLDSLSTVDLRKTVTSITLPTLLISGQRDRVCPAAASAWMEKRLPICRHVMLEGSGHAPHLTHSDEFASVVGGFSAEMSANHV